MKYAAIIPVHGREPLVYHTVSRLVNNGIDVVCCGHTISEKIVCEMAGAEFIQVANIIPLGLKWQMALDKAREYSPDAVLYVGSSDWVTKDWCDVLYKDIKKGFAMAGKDDCYMAHVDPQNKLGVCHWGGYDYKRQRPVSRTIQDTDRLEVVGIGRLFGKKVLDMLDWQIFDTTINSSLDYSQMKALWSIKDKWKGLMISHNKTEEIKSVSISTYRWPNKHNFEKEKHYTTARILNKPEKFLSTYFPELINLFNE